MDKQEIITRHKYIANLHYLKLSFGFFISTHTKKKSFTDIKPVVCHQKQQQQQRFEYIYQRITLLKNQQ